MDNAAAKAIPGGVDRIDSRGPLAGLGKESARVQRVFFVNGGCYNYEDVRGTHCGLITARLGDTADQAFLALFHRTGTLPASQAGRSCLIDPVGNLMMSYAPEAPPQGLIEDLRKHLKLSHIG